MVLVLAVLAAAGCGGSTTPHRAPSAAIEVTSDFKPGGVIPRVHTCDGHDSSPPLRVLGVPVAAKELIVVMRDHDAAGGDFIHWATAHIGPSTMSLAAGATPSGAVLGRNSFGSLGYRGPCPPAGDAAHHYEIAVYALARPSLLTTGFSAGALGSLPVLARGSLTGVYARSQ